MPEVAEPSVKSLLLQTRFDGQPLGSATGFVAESQAGPVLVTNWHVLAGRNPRTKEPLSPQGAIPNEILILHNSAAALGQWIERVEGLEVNGTPRWFEHPTLGDKADFAALPLQQLDNVRLYPYSGLGASDRRISYGPADRVSVVGFPFGLRAGGSLAIWVTGYVASEPTIDFEELPVFLIDCRTRPGQSGSPVLAYRSGGSVTYEDGASAIVSGPVSRFLGIYSGRIREGSDLGFVWRAQAIRDLVDSLG